MEINQLKTILIGSSPS